MTTKKRARLLAAAEQARVALRVLGIDGEDATAVFLMAATAAGKGYLACAENQAAALARFNRGAALMSASWAVESETTRHAAQPANLQPIGAAGSDLVH